jgi:hypothetical protein
MLQYHEIEQLAFERHDALLAAGAREQLLKSLPRAADSQDWLALLRCWFSVRLVKWGTRLQGNEAKVKPDLAVGKPCASLSMR